MGMIKIHLENKIANDASLRLRKGLIADVKTSDMANGEGVRTTVFVSGCLFNCKNCFNKLLQDFNYGAEHSELVKKGKHLKGDFPRYYDKKLEIDIIKSLSPSYIDGLTLLGGEPFMNGNVYVPLCKKVREVYGDSKTIWSWTGYEWDELLASTKLSFPISREQRELLSLIDVLVDGRYVDSIRKLDIERNGSSPHFRGSSNQRIIDVRETLKRGNIVERKDIYGDEIIAKRVVDFTTLTGGETIKQLEEMGL